MKQLAWCCGFVIMKGPCFFSPVQVMYSQFVKWICINVMLGMISQNINSCGGKIFIQDKRKYGYDLPEVWPRKQSKQEGKPFSCISVAPYNTNFQAYCLAKVLWNLPDEELDIFHCCYSLREESLFMWHRGRANCVITTLFSITTAPYHCLTARRFY